MKESKFIEQNKENWLEFEKKLLHKYNQASRLDRLFVQITDDLSYARTFYKTRSVKIYLNGIAQILFNNLYRNKSGNLKSFWNFWKKDLPLCIYEARKEFRISFAIFLFAFAIGILSSIYDKDFSRVILGKDYVEMTLENIKHHDPLAVYKKAHETSMFIGITINNLLVALSTFLFGAFFSFGTVISLIRNAIMVGGFQYFFIEKGLFRESFLTIWQHGTLEISSIIIAGAAGLTMGNGLLFPGSFSRIDAFKNSAQRGLKIFTGISPIIILAAFIEGFVTRHNDVSDFIRIMVIICSLTFVLVYFVVYPLHVARRNSFVPIKKESQRNSENYLLGFNKILSAEEILGHVLSFTKKNIFWLIFLIIAISFIHASGTVMNEVSSGLSNPSFGSHSGYTFFNITGNFFQFCLATTTLAFLIIVTCIRIKKNVEKFLKEKIKKIVYIKFIINSLFIAALVWLPFHFGIFWGLLSSVIISPLMFIAVFYSFFKRTNIIAAMYQLHDYLNFSWKKIFWNSLKITTFLSILYLMVNTPVFWYNVESIYMNFNYDDKIMHLISLFITSFSGTAIFVLYLYLQISVSVITTYNLNETVFAENLKERIDRLGERNSLFGFEKE